MLQESFLRVYEKLKSEFCRQVFALVRERRGSLSAMEAFSLEVIRQLGRPTVSQFAAFLNISQSNATYKVANLIHKGYLEKENSGADRREYYLRPTQKYIDYYSISYSYLHTVIERVRQRFPAEDCDKMEQMLSVISTELMPELDMLAKCRHPEAPKSEE